MSHDLVLRGGLVLDGTDHPARQADVAVDRGRIVSVGRVAAGGREELVRGARTAADAVIASERG